ncbi:MAG: hypothetical protein V7K69_07280 [Nostoc sp.]
MQPPYLRQIFCYLASSDRKARYSDTSGFYAKSCPVGVTGHDLNFRHEKP